MMSKTAAEPLVRISKRDGTTFVQKVLVRAIAILLALVVDAFFIFFVTGLNPISVYGVMWNGTFMNTTRFSWALRDLSTLLCIAIALAPAFKMRFWNIGGEGQVLIGGLVAALIMVYFGSSLPAPLLFAAMVIGSVLAGAIWAFVPAWFKSRWNTNETLFTLMMNYVATSIVACMTNIMRGQASSLGTLNKATKAGWLPVISGQRYTINIIVVLVLTFAMYAYLKYSKQGYEISVVGEVLFSYGFLAYAAIVLAVVLHWFFTRTRAGLNLRAVGENPATADAAGINVTLYKYVATCTGAAICGVGGLYYVLDYNQGIWATTGQIEALGWLAVALVIFTTWKPLNAIWGAYLIGVLYCLYQFLPSLLGITVAS